MGLCLSALLLMLQVNVPVEPRMVKHRDFPYLGLRLGCGGCGQVTHFGLFLSDSLHVELFE
jgi:hypothetical protein